MMLALTSPHDRPARARAARGKWTALALALAVNLLFVGVLVFSVSWQNRKPVGVTAELYAPPPRTAATPAPQPRIEPKPEPPPKPVVKPPEPVVEKPDPREAEIALKARRDEERRQQEQAERERLQREARQQEELRQKDEARQKELARRKEEARKADEKRQADLREQQAKQVESMRAQADREIRMQQMKVQAERESQLRAQAEQEARVRAEQAAAGAARSKAQLDWIDRIRSRIRGYINLPPDIPGNPEAIFDVVQLPTGEIIDVKLRKSSGVRAYDDAVQRAILKASPLPKPVPADLFQRDLELRFRPLDQ